LKFLSHYHLNSIISFILIIFIICGNDRSWSRDIPALTGPIMDEAGIISGEEKKLLEEQVREFVAKGKVQFQIYIIPSLDGEILEEYTIKLTDAWKLGSKEKDNGILFLLSIKDRKMRLEVGQGLEGEVNDAVASRLTNMLKSYFKEGAFFEGLSELLKKVDLILEGIPADKVLQESNKKNGHFPWLPVGIGLIYIFFQMLKMRRYAGLSQTHYKNGHWGGSSGSGFSSGGGIFGGGGSSSGGGGGWSGGGGGFSGGGSSGNW